MNCGCRRGNERPILTYFEGEPRQTAEDLHFGQTRSPGQELVNGSRHIRQGRDLASWACSGSGFLGYSGAMRESLPPIGAHKKRPHRVTGQSNSSDGGAEWSNLVVKIQVGPRMYRIPLSPTIRHTG